jgi:hypothetical protein
MLCRVSARGVSWVVRRAETSARNVPVRAGKRSKLFGGLQGEHFPRSITSTPTPHFQTTRISRKNGSRTPEEEKQVLVAKAATEPQV